MRPRQSRLTGNRFSDAASLVRRHRPDYWLAILSVILLAIGLVVVYAISPALSAAAHVKGNYYVDKQLIAVALSVVAFLFTAKVPLKRWQQAYKPLLAVAAVVTLAALLMPVNAQYPAHRWIRLGAMSFQSVELLKFAVLIWLAALLGNRQRRSKEDDSRVLKPILIALAVIGVVVAFVQSDLGSAGVIVVMMGSMMFVAGLPLKRVLAVGAVIVLVAMLAISTSAYRRERLATFLHPQQDCQSTGYQACQALISVGSGGIIGMGLGRSVQAYGYLPEAANDSIFAIYAEKFGFIGCVILLGLFTALFGKLKYIAERAPDEFSRLLVVGVLTWLSVQTLINIGAMIGLLPLKGITLPFISYGGTSVVFASAAIGLVFQVSHYTAHRLPVTNEAKDRRGYDDSRNRRRVGGAYHPTFSGRSRT